MSVPPTAQHHGHCDNVHDNDALTLLSWNINGWYDNTKSIRKNIIAGMKADIVVLCETHLKDDDKVYVNEHYRTIPHNRMLTHLRAKKNYGGICMLIHRFVDVRYICSTVDKEYDGILAVKFIDKFTKFCFLVIALYLPPEQSTWGRDANSFFAHVLQLIYEYSYCDTIILAGDTNSRIGSIQDFIPEVDDGVSSRTILDKTKNKHGQEMLNFLVESAMCVCNGRVTPQYDNYTFIHSRGKSVIDYIAVPFEFLNQCLEFKVNTARDMVNKHCNIEDEDIDLSKMIPDHSVLTLKFSTSVYNSVRTTHNLQTGEHHQGVQGSDTDTTFNQDHNYFQRYNVMSLPQEFLNNDLARAKLLELIEHIELIRDTQQEIDAIYTEFCETYHKEMNKWLRSRNVHPNAYKRLKRSTKPFWNDKLSSLWNVLCEKEKLYLESKDSSRKRKQQEFYNAQKIFDKEYRKFERNYKKNKIVEIETFSSSDPNKFWESIKKLGPYKKKDIPMEVYDEDGNIVTDLPKVLHKWKNEFQSLYNFQPEPGQFDDNFYDECIRNFTSNTESGYQETFYFHELDDDISLEEVRRVINSTKLRKSVGIDNLPYEIFKDHRSDSMLTLLFNKFYQSGLTPSIWNLAIIKPIPKNSLADPRLPLEYRGISLLSTIYKLFTSVLNNRIVNLAEEHDIYVNEQNGFRKDRSCEDHLFTLSSIIRNRKKEKLPTYVAFVDFEKAFDRIDRNLLFYKLKQMGFGGKFFVLL